MILSFKLNGPTYLSWLRKAEGITAGLTVAVYSHYFKAMSFVLTNSSFIGEQYNVKASAIFYYYTTGSLSDYSYLTALYALYISYQELISASFIPILCPYIIYRSISLSKLRVYFNLGSSILVYPKFRNLPGSPPP